MALPEDEMMKMDCIGSHGAFIGYQTRKKDAGGVCNKVRNQKYERCHS